MGGSRKRYIFARQYRKRFQEFVLQRLLATIISCTKKVTVSGTYKKDRISCFLSFSMAEPHPTNLEDYCKVHNCSLFTLTLPCVFCKFEINYLGLAEFHYKNLSLIYKEGICYACCGSCLKLTAKYEAEQFGRCSVDPRCIEFLCKKPLAEITVRCLCCFKALDLIEKYDCITADLPFVLIRHHWRNYCRHCVKSI